MHNHVIKKRCSWVSVDDPLMLQYHDREWGVPVHDDRKHFEFLVLAAAQAGLRRCKTLFSIRSINRDFHTRDAQFTTTFGRRGPINNDGEYEQTV